VTGFSVDSKDCWWGAAGGVGLGISMVGDCDNAGHFGELLIDLQSELGWEVHKACGFRCLCGCWFVLAILGICLVATLFAVSMLYSSRHFV